MARTINITFHQAVIREQYNLVEDMITCNRNIVNFQDKNGCTGLYYACKYGLSNMIRILIFHGADMNIENDDGLKPIDICHDQSREILIDAMNRNQKMKLQNFTSSSI